MTARSIPDRVASGCGEISRLDMKEGPGRGAGPSELAGMPNGSAQAVKLLPHPHPPVALGLLKVKPEPCIEET